jgi:hypothetical protein
MGAAAVATERPPASTLWGAMLAFLFGMRPFARALRSLKSGGRELKRGIRGDDELPPPVS